MRQMRNWKIFGRTRVKPIANSLLWVSRFYDQRTTFPKIKGTYLKLLPVPVPTKLNQGKLTELAEKRRDLGVKLRTETRERQRAVLANAVQTTDRKIDELVYELYGLTNEEITLVEGGGK